MKKHIPSIIGAIIFIAMVAAMSRAQSATISAKTTKNISSTMPIQATQGRATPSKQPTPTVDYQMTANVAVTQLAVAQATSNEAARINAQATANHEDYMQAQIIATSEADQRNQQKLSWTATAAGTSIPLTSTAQAINSTAIVRYQAMQSAQMTATHEAPAILREMKSAQAYNAIADFWVWVWAMGMFGLFALAVPVALFVVPRKQVPIVAVSIPPVVYPREASPVYVQPETVIRVQNETGNYPRMDKLIVPCTPKKFDEFVRGIILENRTLSINEWEGSGSPFQNRDEYLRIRAFMQMNQLAQAAGSGRLILSARGEEIFNAWIEAGELPTEYKFTEVEG